MNRIQLIEDDLNLGRSLKEYLLKEALHVEWCTSISQARSSLDPKTELIILDWMLPDGQGIDYLRELRSQKNPVPVILLTSRNELVDKVVGLETGANDYMTKPFEPRELIARIRVQLRTPRLDAISSDLQVGPISISSESRTVQLRGTPIELTRMEFDLLKLLCSSPGKVFSRDELLGKVWGFDRFPTTRTVDTHILQLRQKLGEEHFETVRGIGYRVKI